MVERRGNSFCVVHSHPQKPGSKTDQPPGTPIKCFSIDEYGLEGAEEKANNMHYAIVQSEIRQKMGLKE